MSNDQPINTIPDDWGEIELKLIESAGDFWSLFYNMVDTDKLFNTDVFLNSFKYEQLYGLTVIETDSMRNRKAWNDPIFCKYSHYLLPCLCIKKGKTIVIVWSHPRVKQLGLELVLIEKLLQRDTCMYTKSNIFQRISRCFSLIQ